MKFQNQARLCLAVFDFEDHSMLSVCLTFQGLGLPVWKNLTLIWLWRVNLFLVISIDL